MLISSHKIAFSIMNFMIDLIERKVQLETVCVACSELCWFGKKRALLVFFAGPFAVIMFVNVVLFLSSACVVYDTTKTTGGKMQVGAVIMKILSHI